MVIILKYFSWLNTNCNLLPQKKKKNLPVELHAYLDDSVIKLNHTIFDLLVTVM